MASNASQSFEVQNFVNRGYILDSFREYMNPNSPIVVFGLHGIGGSGKSTTLRYLASSLLDSQGAKCGFSYISFQAAQTPPSAPEALWQIRQSIGSGTGYQFPCFDLLWAVWWERTYHTSISQNPSLIPEHAAALAEALADAQSIPYVGSMLKLADLLGSIFRRIAKRNTHRLVREWVQGEIESLLESSSLLRGLQTAELSEIFASLPAALAHDLQLIFEARGVPSKKVVVFVDTYERLIDRHDPGIQAGFIREFGERIAKAGTPVLLVIAGRSQLRWGEEWIEGRWILDEESIWTRGLAVREDRRFVAAHISVATIDALQRPHALEYLTKRRGLEAELAERVFDVAGGYPLALAAIADLIGEDSDETVEDLDRLRLATNNLETFGAAWAKEVGHWIRHRLLARLRESGERELLGLLSAAAIPRRFNEELLYELSGQSANFQDSFDRLVSLGFVENRAPQTAFETRNFSIHPLLRDVIIQGNRVPKQVRDWHFTAYTYFKRSIQENSHDFDLAFDWQIEAVYHEVEWSGELQPLLELFDTLLGLFHVSRAVTLSEVSQDLQVLEASSVTLHNFLRGRIALAIGDYANGIEFLRDAVESEDSVRGGPSREFMGLYLAEGLRLDGQYEACLKHLSQLDQLVGCDNPDLLFALRWERSLVEKVRDRLREALAACNSAEELLPSVEKPLFVDAHTFGEPDLRSDPRNVGRHKAELLRQTGDYRAAALECESFRKAYASQPTSLGYIYAQLTEGHLRRSAGEAASARDLAISSLRAFKEKGNLRGELSAVRLLGQSLLLLGDYRGASEQFERLLRRSDGTYPYGPVYAALGLGEIVRRRGSPHNSIAHYRAAAESGRRLGGILEESYALLGISEARRALGHSEPWHATEALSMNEAIGQPWLKIYSNLCCSAFGDSSASEHLAEAISIERKIVRSAANPSPDSVAIEAVRVALIDGRPVAPIFFDFP